VRAAVTADLEAPLQELAAAGRVVSSRGLTWGPSGNLSLRLDDASFLLSAHGARLGELGPESTVVCSLETDEWHGERRPSAEVGLHRNAYVTRPDVHAVVHASPVFTTLVACTDVEVDPGLTTDSAYYLRRIARVPRLHPGSPDLAAAVGVALAEADVLLLEHHGTVCVGRSLEQTLVRLECLEFLCRLIVEKRQL
jgi:ribulose-5-phosphate 4-epimerase/fuculose-1-phosphate aldolase